MPNLFDTIPASRSVEDDEPNEPADERDVNELLQDIREQLRRHIADAKQYRADCEPGQANRLDVLLDTLKLVWERLP